MSEVKNKNSCENHCWKQAGIYNVQKCIRVCAQEVSQKKGLGFNWNTYRNKVDSYSGVSDPRILQ